MWIVEVLEVLSCNLVSLLIFSLSGNMANNLARHDRASATETTAASGCPIIQAAPPPTLYPVQATPAAVPAPHIHRAGRPSESELNEPDCFTPTQVWFFNKFCSIFCLEIFVWL